MLNGRCLKLQRGRSNPTPSSDDARFCPMLRLLLVVSRPLRQILCCSCRIRFCCLPWLRHPSDLAQLEFLFFGNSFSISDWSSHRSLLSPPPNSDSYLVSVLPFFAHSTCSRPFAPCFPPSVHVGRISILLSDLSAVGDGLHLLRVRLSHVCNNHSCLSCGESNREES